MILIIKVIPRITIIPTILRPVRKYSQISLNNNNVYKIKSSISNIISQIFYKAIDN